MFCFQYCFKKIYSDKKESKSKGLTFNKGLLVVNIPHKLLNSLSLWNYFLWDVVSMMKICEILILCLWIKPAGMQEWKANINNPAWWGTFSEFLLLNHFTFNSYWDCSVCLFVSFSFLALLFSCRTIRTQLNWILVRISPKKSEQLQLKHWELGEEKQTAIFPVVLSWYQMTPQSFCYSFIMLQQLGSCMCTRGQAVCWACWFYSEIMALLLHWTKMVRSSWSNFPNKICFFLFFVSQIYCNNVSAEDVSCSVVSLINMLRETCKEAEAA